MAQTLTAQKAVLEGDKLVMLVKRQKVHLAMARPMPKLKARLILCGLPVDDGEVTGEVDHDDFAVLQDFTICPLCSGTFAAELRDGLLSRVRATQLASQPPPCQERRTFEANQLSLF